MTKTETEIHFKGDGNINLRGIIFTPKFNVGPSPAVIVVHEVDGLTDDIKEIARKFSMRGYVTLAVDLFTG